MKYHKQVKIKCLFCGKERYVFYGDKARGKGKYCNRLCWDKHKRKLPKFIRCKYCGRDFENKTSQRTKRFCSRDCYANYLKGKYPVNLKGKRGVKPRTYHLTKRPKHEGVEYKEWRMKVFKKDNFTCQICGKTSNELKKQGIKICADHIKPYCNYPELRYVVSNGRTVCVPCHKLTETYGIKARHF